MKSANWKQRVITFLIDYSLIIALLLLVGTFFKDDVFHGAFLDLWRSIKSFTLTSDDIILFFGRLSTNTTLYFTIIALTIYFGYFIVLPILWDKQTLGRWGAKVKVVKLNESHLSFGTLLIREFLGKLFLGIMSFGIIWIISIVMMEVATVKRTIHDRMANTLMVQVGKEKSLKDIKE